MKEKEFKIEEINGFIHDHIQSKIDHNELEKTGFDMKNSLNFIHRLYSRVSVMEY